MEAGSRLGLDVADGTAARAVDQVLRSENLRLVGVHSHTQVQQIDPAMHVECLKSLLTFVADAQLATGYRLRTVGLGGGFACRSVMRDAGKDVLNFGTALSAIRDETAPEIELVVEPGRFYVSDAAVGLTRIISRTSARGNKWLMVDLGTQVLVPFEGRQFTIEAAYCGQAMRIKYLLATDFRPTRASSRLKYNYEHLQPVAEGRVQIRSAGAAELVDRLLRHAYR